MKDKHAQRNAIYDEMLKLEAKLKETKKRLRKLQREIVAERHPYPHTGHMEKIGISSQVVYACHDTGIDTIEEAKVALDNGWELPLLSNKQRVKALAVIDAYLRLNPIKESK